MRIAFAAAALVLVLAGCTPGTVVADPTTDPTPTGSVTPTPASEPDALVLGVHGVQYIPGDGSTPTAVSREDPDAGLALLTQLFGDATTVGSELSTTYHWGDDAVMASDSGWFNVRFNAADLDGIELRTSQGIQVGDTRDDVLALDPLDDGYDGSGDGKSDELGLEAEPEPGTDSLTHPGSVGTSYVGAIFGDGDVVIGLFAPGGDWRDV
jgi:hypothetical protein